jgi:hypothetical protein
MAGRKEAKFSILTASNLTEGNNLKKFLDKIGWNSGEVGADLDLEATWGHEFIWKVAIRPGKNGGNDNNVLADTMSVSEYEKYKQQHARPGATHRAAAQPQLTPDEEEQPAPQQQPQRQVAQTIQRPPTTISKPPTTAGARPPAVQKPATVSTQPKPAAAVGTKPTGVAPKAPPTVRKQPAPVPPPVEESAEPQEVLSEEGVAGSEGEITSQPGEEQFTD